jgi:hypothetical protein
MTVTLTVSKTLGGSGVADTLLGGTGTNTGIDLGQVVNSQYTPIILQSANTGQLDLYVSHNAVTDPITNLATYVQQYGTGTSYAYGGANTAAGDLTTLLTYGHASNSTAANNSDGLAGGLQIDMDYAVTTTNQFAHSRLGTQLRIYGLNGASPTAGDGASLALAIPMYSAAMAKTVSGADAAPSTPTTGTVGKSGDVAYGDHAHYKMRFYLPSSAVNGGELQFEYVYSFSFTS